MKSGMGWMAIGLTAVAVWAVSTRLDHAQSAAPGGTHVAVVDLVRVFNEFEQTKVLNEKMQDDRARVVREADHRRQQIKEEETELEAFAPDSADWHTRNQKLKKMNLEHRVWEALEQDRIGEDYLRWLKKTYQMVTDEIGAVAKKQGFELVMTREEVDTSVTDAKVLLQQILNRKVVYSHTSVDLTGQVLLDLNAAFQKAGGAASVKFGR